MAGRKPKGATEVLGVPELAAPAVAKSNRKVPEHAFAFGATPEERQAHIASVLRDSKRDLTVLGRAKRVDVLTIPTGSIRLDVALGVGGWPVHRIVEIFGAEGSGKTTLALHAIANVQRMGGCAAFIDAEHALDITYAKNLGINLDELILDQPDSGEDALDTVLELVPKMNLIIVDSVAALTPRAELEGNMGDVQPGAQARLMSQAMRKLTAAVGRSACCIVFLNQIRTKIGVKFGSPETTSGGNALKFFSSLRVKVTRIGDVKDGEVVTGQRDRVKILKNKLSPPYKVCEFDLIFGEGVSLVNECIDIGLEIGALTRSGSWYSYGDVSVLGTRFAALDGQRIGQGRPHAAHNLGQNPELMARIREIALQSLTASSADRVVDDTEQE